VSDWSARFACTRSTAPRGLFVLLLAAAVAAAVAACSTGDPAMPANLATLEGSPTYHRDVAPILERRCIKCHHEGGIGPFALTDYEQARAMAPVITVETGARRMPPWGAHDTHECVPPLPWREDERMSDEEIMTLRRWDLGGAPEGDSKDSPPADLVSTQSLELDATAIDIAPRAAYLPTSSSLDEFRCFVFDAPEIESGAHISAIHVVPGNRRIVHHVTVFTDRSGALAKRAGPDGSFDCPPGSLDRALPGEEVAPQNATILAWAPGGKPLRLPDGVAIEIAPKSKIVMEVHYSTGARSIEPDLTRLQFSLAATKPKYLVGVWGVGNFGSPLENGDGLQPGENDRDGVVEFRIPAQAESHAETMVATFTHGGALPLFGLRPHAQLAGVEIKVDVLRNGATQCMLQDSWDFHWQRIYTYEAAPEHLPMLYPGDRVRIRCSYNNTMMNRRLAQELRERGLRPMDIFGGPDTLSEMCLADLLLLVKTPE